MKRIGILLIILILLVSGCGNEPVVREPGTVNIITSFYPVYILTLNIIEGVEGARLINMTKPDTGCLHNYKLLPEDMKLIEQADIFVINGAGMEGFMDKIFESKADLPVVDSSAGIELLCSEDDHDHEHGHGHDDEINPHIWLSVPNAIRQVRNIAKGLSDADGKNASLYITNAEKYIQRLEALDGEIREKTKDIKNRNLITFHEAFPYFAQEYGFTVLGVLSQTAENEPSSKAMADIVEAVREHNIKAVFTEPNYPPKSAGVISKETGAQVHSLDPVVTGEMIPEAYEKAMRSNLDTIVRALGE